VLCKKNIGRVKRARAFMFQLLCDYILDDMALYLQVPAKIASCKCKGPFSLKKNFHGQKILRKYHCWKLKIFNFRIFFHGKFVSANHILQKFFSAEKFLGGNLITLRSVYVTQSIKTLGIRIRNAMWDTRRSNIHCLTATWHKVFYKVNWIIPCLRHAVGLLRRHLCGF
jgi:hypothetical protein